MQSQSALNKRLVELRDVTVHRGGRIALDRVSMTLDRGMLLGLIGPNGAGKTTLLEVILGEIEPEQGEVLLDGIPRKKAMAAGFTIGYLPQKHYFEQIIPVTGLRAVTMARYGRIGVLKRVRKSDKEAAMEAMRLVGAEDLADRLVTEVSGGQLQRIMIARALASGSSLLLLDEPEAGVDMETADRFMKLIAKLRDELDLGIILVSHDIGMITRHADAIACINRKLNFHDKPTLLGGDVLQATFGKECELLVHGFPKRTVEGHDV